MAIQKLTILETSIVLNTRFLETSLFQYPYGGKVAGINFSKNPHDISLVEIIADSLTQSLRHNPFIPIWFSKPITYFRIEAFYVRASVETYISSSFRMDFNTIIILYVLRFDILYE